jgi:hypothetical protein
MWCPTYYTLELGSTKTSMVHRAEMFRRSFMEIRPQWMPLTCCLAGTVLGNGTEILASVFSAKVNIVPTRMEVTWEDMFILFYHQFPF